MLSWKQNVPWLNSRNVKMSLRDSCLGFHDFWYCSQSYKRRITAWACKWFVGEKPYPVFVNGNVVGDESGNMCTQRIEVAKILKLCSTFGIWETNKIAIIIIKIEKILLFGIRCLKVHLPLLYNWVTFFFC